MASTPMSVMGLSIGDAELRRSAFEVRQDRVVWLLVDDAPEREPARLSGDLGSVEEAPSEPTLARRLARRAVSLIGRDPWGAPRDDEAARFLRRLVADLAVRRLRGTPTTTDVFDPQGADPSGVVVRWRPLTSSHRPTVDADLRRLLDRICRALMGPPEAWSALPKLGVGEQGTRLARHIMTREALRRFGADRRIIDLETALSAFLRNGGRTLTWVMTHRSVLPLFVDPVARLRSAADGAPVRETGGPMADRARPLSAFESRFRPGRPGTDGPKPTRLTDRALRLYESLGEPETYDAVALPMVWRGRAVDDDVATAFGAVLARSGEPTAPTIFVDPSPAHGRSQAAAFVDLIDEAIGHVSAQAGAAGACYGPWGRIGDRALPPSVPLGACLARYDRLGIERFVGRYRAYGPAQPPVGLGLSGWAPWHVGEHGPAAAPPGERINWLTWVPARGVAPMTQRTLAGADAGPPAAAHLHGRRIGRFVATELRHRLRWTVFEPNTAALRALVRESVSDLLGDLRDVGALSGFAVRCDEELNNADARNRGELLVEVRLGFARAFGELTIGLRLGEEA